jgi:hypothetical protein
LNTAPPTTLSVPGRLVMVLLLSDKALEVFFFIIDVVLEIKKKAVMTELLYCAAYINASGVVKRVALAKCSP